MTKLQKLISKQIDAICVMDLGNSQTDLLNEVLQLEQEIAEERTNNA